MKVGRVPFLHAEPFYFDMVRRGIELYEMVPSALVAAAEHGDIDAGPVPLADCFHLEDRFRPVGGFCVASVKQAGSVLLFSSVPIMELDGATIGITDEASSAPRLLQVLLRLKYGVRPEAFVSLDASYDAFLLIGNQALRQRLGAPGFRHTYDLGAEWHAWTGLPCVFSRWMARKDLASQGPGSPRGYAVRRPRRGGERPVWPGRSAGGPAHAAARYCHVYSRFEVLYRAC